MPTKTESNTTLPSWATRKLTVNIGEKHDRRLAAIIKHLQKDAPRANLSTATEAAIDHYFTSKKLTIS